MLSSHTVKHSKLECGLYSMEPLEIKKKHNKLLVDLRDLMYIESPGYKSFIGILNNAVIPTGRLQQVKSEPLELFRLMEERGQLKEGHYSVLEEALEASGNKEALDLVKKHGSEITKQIKGQGSTTIEETKKVTEKRIKKKEESFGPPDEPEPAPKKQKTASEPEGWVRINNILYQKKPVLGHGCHGTIVYRGKFDKRDVAVKRLQIEHFSLLDREVDLLREADKNHQHPNVIRYFCTEEDSNFLYIALELCAGTLQNYVEDTFKNRINIEPIKLLHQALSGLAYLHSLGIVHRDLKPHNILISSPSAQDEVRAMISDFGLSKKLPPGKRSFSSRSDVFGTEGWVAPEMLKSGQRKTLAVDIFSAGCLMYYVLTKGQHPFGNSDSEIQYKIEQGIFNLDKLPMTSDGEITKDIIQKMLSAEPGIRPTAKAVLHHLLFWDKEKKLKFIQDASDWLEVNMVRNLEQNGANIVRDDWIKYLPQELQNDIQGHYDGSKVKDLLRVIRNKRHDYNELSEDVKKSLGSLPEQFLDCFTSRFPFLLIHTYRVMECCAKEAAFKDYYITE